MQKKHDFQNIDFEKNSSHLPLLFYSTPNKCLGTVFTFHVTQPKKKVPSVGSFDPHWVV